MSKQHTDMNILHSLVGIIKCCEVANPQETEDNQSVLMYLTDIEKVIAKVAAKNDLIITLIEIDMPQLASRYNYTLYNAVNPTLADYKVLLSAHYTSLYNAGSNNQFIKDIVEAGEDAKRFAHCLGYYLPTPKPVTPGLRKRMIEQTGYIPQDPDNLTLDDLSKIAKLLSASFKEGVMRDWEANLRLSGSHQNITTKQHY
jgi:hypothetical protein